MISEARKKMTESGEILKTLSIEYYISEAEKMDFDDSTFDGCRSERTFMHLSDPKKAFAEMIRVTQSGGYIVVFDLDWDAFVIYHPDKILTRKVIHLMCDKIRQGIVGRQLYHLFKSNNLTNITVIPHSIVPTYFFFKEICDGLLKGAEGSGLITESEYNSWWNYLDYANRIGQFYASQTGFIVRGIKL